MKRIFRIRQLNELLRNHNGCTIADMVAILNVGERTIRKDLEKIQQSPYNAEFWNEYRGRERLYRYKDINFSLPIFDENDESRIKINEAIKAIEKYQGIPQFDWLRLCLMSIDNGSVVGTGNVMSFDNNAYLEGIEHLQSLLDAIINKYPIKLTYKPFHSSEHVIHVHPYHLKQ